MQTFATFFFWKTINSAALSSASLFFFFCTTPLPLLLPLAIVFTQTERIYSQKSEACAGGEIVDIFLHLICNLLIDSTTLLLQLVDFMGVSS